VVHDRGRGGDERQVELALEPRLHDVGVQQAQEAAAEAEAERLAGLGLERERGVVQAQLLERLAQARVVLGVGRVEAAEHDRHGGLEAGDVGSRSAGRRA
jgi:hypothetical protein